MDSRSIYGSNRETVGDLRTNWLDLAFGVDTPPVFGWQMESKRRGAFQKAYRINVVKDVNGKETVWDSGRVESPLSAAIPYEGAPLLPATRYWWRVEVETDQGEILASAATRFETGLLTEEGWDGSSWIMADPEGPGAESHPAMALRTALVNRKAIRTARWFVTGLGVFEAYVNSHRVSNLGIHGRFSLHDELKPGFTDARKTRQYFSYDITHLLEKDAGETNYLAAVVTSGWWSDQITGEIGKRNAFRGQLVVTYDDGTEERLGTGTSWDAAFAGSVVKAEIHYGEDHDARDDMGWLSGGPLDARWGKAVVNDEFHGRIVPLQGPPVRVRDDLELRPSSIRILDAKDFADATEERFGTARILREYHDGENVRLLPGELLLVDFAQNCVGWERLRVMGDEGTELLIRHAEMLNDGKGAKSRGNDGPEGTPYYRNLRNARASSRYILSGTGEEDFHPLFSFYGYRYLAIATNAPVEFGVIRAQVVNSIPKGDDTGSLTTSNSLLNRLIRNCRWGHYGNYLSVPTDCPQRDERLGWTADTQVFTPAAAYDGLSYGFLSKFMRDMRDAQGPEGGFPGVAPFAQYGNEQNCVGWADAAILVPYHMWRFYGDTTILRENYEAMGRHMELLERGDGPVPHWGDWLAYERNDDDLQLYICACYYVWDARLMAEMAEALGDEKGTARYRALDAKATDFFRRTYLNEDGTIQEAYLCQTACLFALYLDLNGNIAAAEATRRALLENIHAHGDKLQTGFLGTAILMDTLAKTGDIDVAYTLLLQRGEPSWLYPVDNGATTMWERWNSYTKEKGFGDAGMNSFNHYAYGAVLAWMFSTMAGIRQDPEEAGFRRFLLAPRPDSRIREVRGGYRTPYGLVKSSWSYGRNGSWDYTATIPANSSATLLLPCPDLDRLTINGEAVSEVTVSHDSLVFRGVENGFARFDAVAGSFVAHIDP